MGGGLVMDEREGLVCFYGLALGAMAAMLKLDGGHLAKAQSTQTRRFGVD